MIKVVAFDADDTLWHNEPIFVSTRNRYIEMLAGYVDATTIETRLYDTEMKNLGHFGYGVKSFTLSMIETAVELTGGQVRASEISGIIELGKEMLRHPVELLDGAAETVRDMSSRFRLMIVTKGDLFDQETKIARSGLGDFFSNIEVMSDKHRAAYSRLLSTYELDPQEFVMIGNSLRSDILPVCELGANAIFVPYATTWEHEHVEDDVASQHDFKTANTIRAVPSIVASLN